MPLYHILILALVQGVSEFLPISSSGHLVLAHSLLGEGTQDLCWSQNRMIDVAVHVGTLLAVLVYSRRDIINIATHITKPQSSSFNLLRHIIIASVPVIIIGFILNSLQLSILCMLEVMAWMTLIFGVVLWIADRVDSTRKIEEMSHKNAFLIGLSQALALIPGVSRSGITMTTARFMGFSRIEAARFSLLLSVIAISGAGVLGAYDLFQTNNLMFGLDILLAVFLAFMSGWVAIIVMMRWLEKATFKPFAIYRIILGIGLLMMIYGGFI